MPTTTTTATLTAPVLTATTISNTTGRLSWTTSAGATGYEIYYMNGGQAVPLGSVSASTTSVTISGMAPGTTYEFQVVAYNRTSQAASQWTALTTSGSAAAPRGRGGRHTGQPDDDPCRFIVGNGRSVTWTAAGRRHVQPGRREQFRQPVRSVADWSRRSSAARRQSTRLSAARCPPRRPPVLNPRRALATRSPATAEWATADWATLPLLNSTRSSPLASKITLSAGRGAAFPRPRWQARHRRRTTKPSSAAAWSRVSTRFSDATSSGPRRSRPRRMVPARSRHPSRLMPWPAPASRSSRAWQCWRSASRYRPCGPKADDRINRQNQNNRC